MIPTAAVTTGTLRSAGNNMWKKEKWSSCLQKKHAMQEEKTKTFGARLEEKTKTFSAQQKKEKRKLGMGGEKGPCYFELDESFPWFKPLYKVANKNR